ncbi:Beta-lactamase class D (YbxI) (PDB:5CTN) [Commensalibacter papalotli (ex Botero et al. 2024)]|uniref:Beta-lactamase n=2 Tax=Commensalibacter papalotli (ex Botero et al. 2024) TaxID=2972766 RepID=A0ABM9HJJ1_9PROT|nr:Beta-lactamase class D (YbxI) (PDB:5CTN) [Commensalibacter papalotli (ex Botero et al. 2024)]CAI3926692.1 Beta-lactamase class D (YbxI) (PDB:5CTN) [Commensalibacter papalotli (ex Botero et al. 2024)]
MLAIMLNDDLREYQMKKNWQFFILLLLISCAGLVSIPAHAENKVIQITQRQQLKIKQLFDQLHTQGVIIIDSNNKITAYGNSLTRAQTYYNPASTFKILNALIGLENNKATPKTIFKWDGKKHFLSSWDKDMTLGEAMRLSAVPVYQELARRTGLSLMQKEVKRVHFGNENIGHQVDKFWLSGPLKVTPVQEAQFVYKLAHQQLPFKKQVQDEVRNMLFIDVINGNEIYAKSGLGINKTPQVGWLTGWVEKTNGEKIAFSLNLEMKPEFPPSLRRDLINKSLKILEIL